MLQVHGIHIQGTIFRSSTTPLIMPQAVSLKLSNSVILVLQLQVHKQTQRGTCKCASQSISMCFGNKHDQQFLTVMT